MVDFGDNNVVQVDYEEYRLIVIDLGDDAVVHVEYEEHRRSHKNPRRK